MKNDLVEITVKHVMPTANGCAVFLGNDAKNFVIYVDHFVGSVIQMTLDGAKKERPLTHDLIGHIFIGLGAQIDSVVINDAKEGAFFARLRLRMENELGKKILELDARPSDTIALALQHKRAIFVNRAVFDDAEDMTDTLNRILKQDQETASGSPETNSLKNIFPGITDEDLATLEDDDDDDDEDEDEDDEDDYDDDEDDDEDDEKEKS